ncbi:MAG: hypothetical protein OXN89_05045 [Bryobacterales bacterium]|nr:hypothetical protein [Bryobacterales bacterium]
MKRWAGSGGKAALTIHDARVRHVWRLHDEGRTVREIADEMGWRSIGTVAYHLHRRRPPRHDMALSEILQRADEAARLFDEKVPCSVPISSRRGQSSNAYRPWLEINICEETAHRARDGTWRIGPFRC